MANSYPRRDQARGLWKINDITKNIKDEGTYPNGSTRALFHGGAVIFKNKYSRTINNMKLQVMQLITVIYLQTSV